MEEKPMPPNRSSYGWTVSSMNFGLDHVGPFLFFVDGNGNKHRVDFNINQTMLLLRQAAEVMTR